MPGIEHELQLSEEAGQDLEHMQEVSLRRRYSTLYYLVYHAARAALLSQGYDPRTHKGVDSLVHTGLLLENELITEEESETYSKLWTRREQADYQQVFHGSEEEFNELQEKAEPLADTFREIAVTEQ